MSDNQLSNNQQSNNQQSDNQQWQAPGAATAQGGQAPVEGSAVPPPPPPAWPAQNAGFPPPMASPPPAWTPPPKPGLIPLRPLTLGTMLSASFQVLRRNPRPTLGASLLITGIISLISLGVVGVVTAMSIARISSAASASDASTISAGSTAITVLASVVPSILSLAASSILQGIIVIEVSRATVGEKLKLRGLWRRARGRILVLVGWALLVGAVAVVAIAIVVVGIALLIAAFGTVGIVIGVILGLLCGAGFLVLAIWLGTKLCLVASALVLERMTLRKAIGRSWRLTSGSFWKVFGVQALMYVILNTVTSAVVFALYVIVILVVVLANPAKNPQASLVAGIISAVVIVAVVIVVGAITQVIQSATTALIYIDLRMRKEGLDLELARFVEARQANDATVVDPYLPVPAAEMTAAAGETAVSPAEKAPA